MMKITMPELKTSCLFDPNIDNNGGSIYKRMGLLKLSRITISAMGRILQYQPTHGLKRICRCVWRTRSSISALNVPPTNSLIC